jgi:hypothetical protein
MSAPWIQSAALIALASVALSSACTRSAEGKENAMADPAAASKSSASGLSLSASVTGTQLKLTLENHGAAPVKVNSHVKAGSRVDLDWFTATVRIDGTTRELKFTGPRDRSARVQETLAAGGSLHHDVDLAWWAQQPINGGRPLPTGKGTLVASYEVTGDASVWNGRIEAPAVDIRW